MSRSGYSDDCCENLELYRASVDRALHGKRGQAFLRELAAAMDAMPEKVLIAGELVSEKGECCTIGVVCKSRQLDVSHVDYYDTDSVAKAIGVARSMAAEIAHINDDDEHEWGGASELPSERWSRMRKWVSGNLVLTPRVLRRVVKYEYVGACRYTGYIAKSIHLTLECGHEQFRKASQGVPLRAKCLECTKQQKRPN